MRKRIWMMIFAAFGVLCLILDTKTGIYGAAEGLRLCIQTVIPSLLPFFVLSILLTSALSGVALPILRPLGKLCGIPAGAEALLLTGLLGGYPAGSQCIAQCWENGQISAKTAHRLLGFCNNAGPSFLFGIVASRFSHGRIAWALWLTHIASALLTGMILPSKSDASKPMTKSNPISLHQALRKSVLIMAEVCGWIIFSRTVLSFCDRWFFWAFPQWVQVLLTGIGELSNGCMALVAVSSDGLRFIICSIMLSFGGICVLLQTVSVTGKLGLGMYLPGKAIQTLVSFLLSCMIQSLLFAGTDRADITPLIPAIAGIALLTMCIFLRKYKNFSSNRQKIVV